MNKEMTLSYRWVHKAKHRYYRIIVSKDLLGDWVVTRVWGGVNQKSGRAIHLPCSSYDDAKRFIDKMMKIRRQRGYELCETADI